MLPTTQNYVPATIFLFFPIFSGVTLYEFIEVLAVYMHAQLVPCAGSATAVRLEPSAFERIRQSM